MQSASVMRQPPTDAHVALAIGIGGIAMLAATSLERAPLTLGPLGVEAGFTVVLLAYLYARNEWGFRPALVAMLPGVGAQLTLLMRHHATFAWLGAELCVVAALELAMLGLRVVLAPSGSTPAPRRVTSTPSWSAKRSTRAVGKPLPAST